MVFIPTPKGLKLDERIVEQSIEQSVSLDDLIIEAQSPRDKSGDKKLFNFGQSLQRLRDKGYSRHLRPAESIGVLIDSLKNKSNSKYKDLAKDMIECSGEWLSVAFKIDGDDLLVYLDPENLVWFCEKGIYVADGYTEVLHHSGEFKFNISGIQDLDQGTDLKEFPTEFVELMYGRKFDDLPRQMREGENKARVYLPLYTNLRPVSLCNRYSMNSNYYKRESRGVRIK